MALMRILPLFFLLFTLPAKASAPSGLDWFTIATPHFRVHHTAPLEAYARSLARTLEWALPQIERRLRWKAPAPVDVVVMDNSDSANGFAANFPNTHIEVLASPFADDSVLAYYFDWANELGSHELTHIVANDTTHGFYKVLRTIFGSWVKPNGLEPTWLSEGLAVYEETSLTPGGRGRSPLTEALLRVAVNRQKLDSDDYTSLDRFNDGAPWWPGGNTAYLLGYTIQALPSHENPDLPGLVASDNAGNFPWSPNAALENVDNHNWAEIWSHAEKSLSPRYATITGADLPCGLTRGGNFTGGQAVSSDGWIYFSEEDWDQGDHLSRVRADAPCNRAEVERLWFKRYGGPSQVAVSPNGRYVAFSAYDEGFETFFSDIYLWDRDKKENRRLTRDLRGRDPAFAENDTLFFVKANPDTSESIIRHERGNGAERVLLTTKPLEKISGLNGRGSSLVFSWHDNKGHQKIFTLPAAGGSPKQLLPSRAEREFERNPSLAADGSVYFAASYGNSPQEIYRFDPTTNEAVVVLRSSSGYLDRPTLLADGKNMAALDYGLNGLNLVRAEFSPQPPVPAMAPAAEKDLHEFLTGEPAPSPMSKQAEPPASVPYSATSTPGTSLWPQYWLPDVVFAPNGALLGASTSGNDALNYHQYFLRLDADTRAPFPEYQAYYHNRSHNTAFHFEADQGNDYFLSTRQSNRNSRYSMEAISPVGDSFLAYGGAYQERTLFGVHSYNILGFGDFSYDRSGHTPSAISQNFGQTVNLFSALYPRSKHEGFFADIRPDLHLYFAGFLPSHSVSVSASAGITTNRLLASNYFLGGGPSALSSSAYVVRGYPNDTLFGQRVAVANLAYTLPIVHPYHGGATFPFFIQDLGLRFAADAGSANFLAIYDGKNFQYYQPQRLGQRNIVGFGSDFLVDGSVLYHVPYSLSFGLHYGPQKANGGATVLFLGLGVGLSGLNSKPVNPPQTAHAASF
jgi:hypothetical protein